jgi:hypothetical protein
MWWALPVVSFKNALWHVTHISAVRSAGSAERSMCRLMLA